MTIRLIIILHSALLDAALPSSLPHLLTPSPSLPLADSLSLSLTLTLTLSLSLSIYISLSFLSLFLFYDNLLSFLCFLNETGKTGVHMKWISKS